MAPFFGWYGHFFQYPQHHEYLLYPSEYKLCFFNLRNLIVKTTAGS